jgi:TfoX/Sxy family transcriptional regulator of competence genes
MAYDEDLAERIREIVQREDGLSEKKMFGGLAFLVNGNMAVAASGQGGLLLRVDPDQTEQLIEDADATRFVMRGREMDGWLRIDPAGTRSEERLACWVGIGVAYARSLPAK